MWALGLLPLPIRAELFELEMREHSGDPVMRGLRRVLSGKSKRAFQHLVEGNHIAIGQPPANSLLPDIDDVARVLLDGGERFEFGRFEMPRRAGLVANNRLRPQLIAIALQAANINGVGARDRPISAITGRI